MHLLPQRLKTNKSKHLVCLYINFYNMIIKIEYLNYFFLAKRTSKMSSSDSSRQRSSRPEPEQSESSRPDSDHILPVLKFKIFDGCSHDDTAGFNLVKTESIEDLFARIMKDFYSFTLDKDGQRLSSKYTNLYLYANKLPKENKVFSYTISSPIFGDLFRVDKISFASEDGKKKKYEKYINANFYILRTISEMLEHVEIIFSVLLDNYYDTFEPNLDKILGLLGGNQQEPHLMVFKLYSMMFDFLRDDDFGNFYLFYQEILGFKCVPKIKEHVQVSRVDFLRAKHTSMRNLEIYIQKIFD